MEFSPTRTGSIHVDDCLVSGEMRDLSWFRGELARKYELKVEIAGWEHGDLREIGFLGRPSGLPTVELSLKETSNHVKTLEEWGWAVETLCRLRT